MKISAQRTKGVKLVFPSAPPHLAPLPFLYPKHAKLSTTLQPLSLANDHHWILARSSPSFPSREEHGVLKLPLWTPPSSPRPQ